MNPKLFSPTSPGELVRLPRDPATGNEHAFVPSTLPPAWGFPLSLWPLLAEAKQQLGILEGIGRSLPNPGILLRPLSDRESIRSSRLEGTFVTATELLVYELQPQESKSEDDPANSQREVYNYRRAMEQGGTGKLPISLRLVRQLHETLMSGVRGKDRTPGAFRSGQVAIGSNHRFVPPPSDRLMECLDRLERYIHAEQSNFDPLVNCFLVHYQFETIHPFNDGNGRVGRLLLALMIKEFCGLSKPWIYMSEYYDKHREEYTENLFNVSAKAAWDHWIEFCLRGVAVQAKDAIQRCARLQDAKDVYMKRVREVGGDVRLTQIVEDVFVSPFVRLASLPARLGVTYPTAKKDIERLMEAKILSELPNITPKTYYAPEVFNIAYAELEQT